MKLFNVVWSKPKRVVCTRAQDAEIMLYFTHLQRMHLTPAQRVKAWEDAH